MGVVRLLSLCTLLLSFDQQTSGQSPKTPAMWNIQLATEYPNPMINASGCGIKAESAPIRICDPNRVFTPADGDGYNSKLKGLEGLTSDGSSDVNCLCNEKCSEPRIVMVVALMQSLGPNIHDFSAEANALTDKFHEIWKLCNCSVVLVYSENDKTYYIDPGNSVDFLTQNVTDAIDKEVRGLFVNGKPEEGVNLTISLYREALNKRAKKAKAEKEQKEKLDQEKADQEKIPIAAIIVPIVIVAIIAIIIIAIVIYVKNRGNSRKGAAKESKALKVDM